MEAYDFYELTKKTLENMALRRGISKDELKKYYTITDKYSDFYKDLSGIPQVFAQMAFHAQNATMISNIVKFEENYDFLKLKTKNFVPKEFLKEYSITNHEKTIENIVEAFRFDGKAGLIWNSSKSKPENKDKIMIRYANTLLECAKYLEGFTTREEVLIDLKKNEDDLINYFRGKIKHGFSIALTCDFIKEFDEEFSYLPKPDVHIKDVMIALKGKPLNYYNTEKKEFELIKEMQELTNEINSKLKENNEDLITVYHLDRMIWLICSDTFYLHENRNSSSKSRFLYAISKHSYN